MKKRATTPSDQADDVDELRQAARRALEHLDTLQRAIREDLATIEGHGTGKPAVAAYTIKRAIDSAAVAWAHYRNHDGGYAKKWGVAIRAFVLLERARCMVAHPNEGVEPLEKLCHTPEEALARTVDEVAVEVADDVEGLGQIDRDAWAKAIGAWRGYNRGRCGRPQKGVKQYSWAEVLWSLLKSAELTDEKSPKGLATLLRKEGLLPSEPTPSK